MGTYVDVVYCLGGCICGGIIVGRTRTVGDLMGKIIIGLIVATLLFASFGCISLGSGADGTATDSIARISYGGWIWKTWRVELVNDHPLSDGNYGTIQQRYGVAAQDTELIKQLQQYQESGQKVRIYYKSNLFVFDWDSSDAEVIVKVEAMQ